MNCYKFLTTCWDLTPKNVTGQRSLEKIQVTHKAAAGEPQHFTTCYSMPSPSHFTSTKTHLTCEKLQFNLHKRVSRIMFAKCCHIYMWKSYLEPTLTIRKHLLNMGVCVAVVPEKWIYVSCMIDFDRIPNMKSTMLGPCENRIYWDPAHPSRVPIYSIFAWSQNCRFYFGIL